MKLSKRKNDVKFFDLETGKQVCSFNQCIDKFTIETSEVRSVYRKWKTDGEPITSIKYYHQCNECGRKVASKEDKKHSWLSYERSIGSDTLIPGTGDVDDNY